MSSTLSLAVAVLLGAAVGATGTWLVMRARAAPGPAASSPPAAAVASAGEETGPVPPSADLHNILTASRSVVEELEERYRDASAGSREQSEGSGEKRPRPRRRASGRRPPGEGSSPRSR